MQSINVTLKAEANYNQTKYTKFYIIELKGCDVKDCFK